MSWTRRQFLATTSLTGAGLLAGRGRAAHAQGKAITASHSVSTFVYGQHLVAKEKKFFEEEGLSLPSFIVPGGGAKVVQALAAGHELQPAEEQVEAVRPTLVLCWSSRRVRAVSRPRMRVERPLRHRVALDGEEVAAVLRQRPRAEGALVLGGEVGLVLGEDRGRERHYRLDPRPLAVVASLLASLTVSRRAPVSAAALDALETEVRRTARARRTAPTKRRDSA